MEKLATNLQNIVKERVFGEFLKILFYTDAHRLEVHRNPSSRITNAETRCPQIGCF